MIASIDIMKITNSGMSDFGSLLLDIDFVFSFIN